MKGIFEYEPTTGIITDKNGLSFAMLNMIPFDEDKSQLVLDLIKQGVTPDEIIKLKNNDLL